MAKLTEEEELAILFPDPVPFKVGRITLMVAPMDAGTCAKFAVKARPIIRAALASEQSFAVGPDGKITDEALVNVLGAIIVAAGDYPDELFAALAIAVGRPVDFLEKLPPRSVTDLARLVFKVNAEFFAQGDDPAAFVAPTKSSGEAPPIGVGPTH